MSSLPMQKCGKVDEESSTSWGLKPALESFLDILNQGAFPDVTFIVGSSGERIPCHRAFLMARSPVFKVMFNERWNPDQEVPLENVEPKIFKKFLEFIYADIFVADTTEALELLQLAHKYNVQLLFRKCEKLLESEVTLDNAADVFQVTRKFDMIQLMDKAGDLMAKSLSKLQTLPSFSRLDKETLMCILERGDLKMKEVELFCLAVNWAKTQAGATVQESLEDILPLIRFPIMTLNEFTTTVVPTGLLSKSKLIQLFTYFGHDSEARRSLASTLNLSTKWRQSPDAHVSAVPLYSVDFATSKIRRQKYMQLRECIQFSVDVVCDSGFLVSSPPRPSSQFGLAEVNNKQEKQTGLHGLDFYCPPTSKQDLSSETFTTSTLTKEFRILVKGKSEFEGYWKPLHTLSSVNCKEGQLTEVEFKTVIPFESGMLCRIEVEDITNEGRLVYPQYYEFRELGEIHQRVVKAFREKSVEIGNFQHFHLGVRLSGQNLIARPQLIYNLRLKEW